MRLWPIAFSGVWLSACTAIPAAATTYKFATFNFPQGNYGGVLGINDTGQVAGWYEAPGASFTAGFIRQANGNVTTLSQDGANVTVTGVNASGTAIGWTGNGSESGFTFTTAGGLTTFSQPGMTVTRPIAENATGEMLVSSAIGNGPNAYYLRSADGSTYLPISGVGPDDTLAGLNDADQVTGSAAGSPFVLAVNSNRRRYFDIPNAAGTNVAGINDLGVIVGYTEEYRGEQSQSGVVIQPDGSYQEFSFPGSNFTVAFGINNLGQIAGEYSDANGDHGFIASPEAALVPEPASWALIMALLSIPVLRRVSSALPSQRRYPPQF